MVTRDPRTPLRAQILQAIRTAEHPLTTTELARAVGERTDVPSLRRIHYQTDVLEKRGLIEVIRNGTGRGHANTFRASAPAGSDGAR